MKCPVEYYETVFEDIDKLAGVHKTGFYPFSSRSAKHVTLRNASLQKYVEGFPKQQDSQYINSLHIP